MKLAYFMFKMNVYIYSLLIKDNYINNVYTIEELYVITGQEVWRMPG